MANAKLEKLQAQLDTYKIELKNYENEFLANNGKIAPEEQELLNMIRGMIHNINEELGKKKERSIETTETGIPSKFTKGLAQISTMIDQLTTKTQKIKTVGKLDSFRDKILTNIKNIEDNFQKLEAIFINSQQEIQDKCLEQVNEKREVLKKLKDLLTTKEVTPSFHKKVTQAKTNIQALMDRVLAIKKQFS